VSAYIVLLCKHENYVYPFVPYVLWHCIKITQAMITKFVLKYSPGPWDSTLYWISLI